MYDFLSFSFLSFVSRGSCARRSAQSAPRIGQACWLARATFRRGLFAILFVNLVFVCFSKICIIHKRSRRHTNRAKLTERHDGAEPDSEIAIFPDGSDRDLDYGFMPAAARNILSDPDLEQFMRDAIYMLHRELSKIRKDVDAFKAQGDPALLAAIGMLFYAPLAQLCFLSMALCVCFMKFHARLKHTSRITRQRLERRQKKP